MTTQGTLLKFTGDCVQGMDVYNPTAPFSDDGETRLAARVESRDSETDSHVRFFRMVNTDTWECVPDTPDLPLQDPFTTWIHGELIVGGVRFPVGDMQWETWFYRGEDVASLKHFASGPRGMKDIRLVELKDGRIGVFSRPQGKVGGRGKIGFLIINTLDELEKVDIYNAPLIEGQYTDDTWGGVNEAQLLEDGRIGCLGHAAEFRKHASGMEVKHYRSVSFVFDPVTLTATPLKTAAERHVFPVGEAKRSPELDDIVISGGLNRFANGMAELYVGLSDVNCGRVVIKDPFVL